jgi:hypothetical protein
MGDWGDNVGTFRPVTCAEYSKKHNPLDIPGWKRFRRYSKNDKKIYRLVNQARMKHFRRYPFWKFGILVPRTHLQALELDQSNGNTKWYQAEETEMKQLLQFNTFADKSQGGDAPSGYKKIRCHMLVRKPLRFECRIVDNLEDV